MKGDNQRRKTCCPKGHKYDEANTRIWRGRRIYRRCHADRMNATRKAAA